jgi:hypothetical protein
MSESVSKSEVAKFGEWVSGKPPKAGAYLAFFPSTAISDVWFEQGEFWHRGRVVSITHWMPLPAPPAHEQVKS